MIHVIMFEFVNQIRDYLRDNNIPFDIRVLQGGKNVFIEVKKGILSDKQLYQIKKLERKFGNGL